VSLNEVLTARLRTTKINELARLAFRGLDVGIAKALMAHKDITTTLRRAGLPFLSSRGKRRWA
jgi:hypothetical protein